MMITQSAPGVSGDTIEFKGTMDSPGRNLEDLPVRSVTRMVDKDTHVYEMYCQDGEGNEFRNMEITYKRA